MDILGLAAISIELAPAWVNVVDASQVDDHIRVPSTT
jgi:hypothetical protein